MKFNIKINEKYTLGLCFLINLVLTLFYFLTSSEQAINYLFNGDLLFMNNLYKDFFVNGFGLEGWTFPGGQFFFPDMLLYFPLKALIGNVGVILIVYVLIQQSLILVGIFLLIKEIFGNNSIRIASIAILMFSFIPAIAILNNEYLFPFYLYTINFHIGAFLTSLFYMVLAFRYLKQAKHSTLLGLFLLLYLGVLSDKIFIILGPLPLLISVVLMFRKYEKKVVFMLFLTTIIAFSLSLFSLNLIKNYYIGITKINIPLSFEAFKYSLSIVVPQTWSYITNLDIRTIVILSYPASIILSIYIILKKNSIKGSREYAFALVVLFFLLIVFWTPIITGIYRYQPMIRYNITVYYISLISLIPLTLISGIVKYEQTKYVLTVLLVFLGFALSKGAFFMEKKSFSYYANHYPRHVECLDSLNTVYDLKNGLSLYSHSTQLRALGKNNLCVYNVHPHNLQCDFFLSNKNWYHNFDSDDNQPVFNYFYLPTFRADSLLHVVFDTIYKYEKIDGMHFYLTPDFTYSKDRKLKLLKN